MLQSSVTRLDEKRKDAAGQARQMHVMAAEGYLREIQGKLIVTVPKCRSLVAHYLEQLSLTFG